MDLIGIDTIQALVSVEFKLTKKERNPMPGK